MLHRNQRGLGLIEVLLTILVVSLFALSVAAMMPLSTQMRVKADGYSKAVNAAQIMLERIRTLDYSQLTFSQMQSAGLVQTLTSTTANGFVASFQQMNLGNGVTVDLRTYLPQGSGSVEVTELFDGNGRSLDLRSITVTITWREKNNQTRQVQLSTIMAKLR